MKLRPAPLRLACAISGSLATFMPSSLRTSALPLLLEMPRLHCFATTCPAPAATNAAAVETLNVFASDEPVPAISTAFFGDLTLIAALRMTLAMPASSSGVSPLAVNAVRAAAIWIEPTWPPVIALKKPTESLNERSSPRISRAKYGNSGVSAFALVAVSGADCSQDVFDADIFN